MNLGDDLRVADDTDITPLWNAILQSAPGRARGVLHQSGAGYDAALFDIGTQAGETGAFQLQQDLLEAFSGVSDLGVSVIATSSEIISNVIVNELADSQTRSLLLTLVVATVVLMISFWFENRRPFLGVLTMLPVALVVFWTYGLMYATGIPFGPVTATLAALAVGIGVPYTIHIARRFEEDRLRFEDLKDALRSTCRHTGGGVGRIGLHDHGRIRNSDDLHTDPLPADGTGHCLRHWLVPGRVRPGVAIAAGPLGSLAPSPERSQCGVLAGNQTFSSEVDETTSGGAQDAAPTPSRLAGRRLPRSGHEL